MVPQVVPWTPTSITTRVIAIMLAILLSAVACAADPAGHDTTNDAPSAEESAAAVAAATSPTSSAEAAVPTETSVPSESAVPSESLVPTESAVPTESIVPSETAAPTEPIAPSETAVPSPAANAGVAGPPRNLRNGCATADLDTDWFPEKLDGTEGITVAYRGNIKVVTVGDVAAGSGTTLVLQQCGTSLPTDRPDGVVVEVPVAEVATDAADLIAAFAALGHPGAVVAVGSTADVTVVQAPSDGAAAANPAAGNPQVTLGASATLSEDGWITLAAVLLNIEADAQASLTGG